jgi:hypothetical protein
MHEPFLEQFEFGPPASIPAEPRNLLTNWILLPPSTSILNSLGLTLKFERSQMLLEVLCLRSLSPFRWLCSHSSFVQISNRVAGVQFVSASPNADKGIDIVASVRDASGAPVVGRSLSCWIRSTCGLVNAMVPGWSDTFSWIRIADSLRAGPGTGSESATSELSLPSYCSSAGYPQYVRLIIMHHYHFKNSYGLLSRFLISIRALMPLTCLASCLNISPLFRLYRN